MTGVAKAIAALFFAVGTWGATAVAEGGIDGVEWFGLLLALSTVAAVYATPNKP